MDDFSKIFESYPDYDVFGDKSEIRNPKRERAYKDNEYIQYNEKTDFRSQTPEPVEVIEEEEHSTDYGDDYGIYRIYEVKNKNYGTIFFFPTLLFWLEIVLKLACAQNIFSLGTFFALLFSICFGSVLTVACTFFASRLNRTLANLLAGVITLWYFVQMVSFGLNGEFILFSAFNQTPQSFQAVMDMMSEKAIFMVFGIIPFAVSLIAGKYILPFRRIRVPAKVCLLLLAVLVYLGGITAVSLDKNSIHAPTNYSIYHENYQGKTVQEEFGLAVMQVKDILNM